MRRADVQVALTGPARSMSTPFAVPLSLFDRCVILGIGFALQFNVMTATFGLPFMRLSDILPFLTIPYFLLRPGMLTTLLSRSLPIGLVLLPLAASLVLKSAPEQGDVYLTLVLLMYVVQAIQLVVLFRDPSGPVWFSVGFLAGLVGALGTLVAQSLSIDLAAVGLAVPTDGLDPELILFMKDKLGGLWAAGNTTGHVFGLAGVAAMYLWHRTGRSEIYVLYFVVLMASFTMTNNRAGLIVPAIVLALVIRRSVGAYAVLSATAAVCALVMVFGATGYTPLPQQFETAIEKRFLSESHTESNVDERFATTVAAVQIIATNPFGLGAIASQNELRAMSGLMTPHNGILSLAIQSGVVVALLFVFGAGRIVLAPERFGPFPYYAVLFMVPSLMFEELTNSQAFLFFIAFVIAASVMTPMGEPAAEA